MSLFFFIPLSTFSLISLFLCFSLSISFSVCLFLLSFWSLSSLSISWFCYFISLTICFSFVIVFFPFFFFFFFFFFSSFFFLFFCFFLFFVSFPVSLSYCLFVSLSFSLFLYMDGHSVTVT